MKNSRSLHAMNKTYRALLFVLVMAPLTIFVTCSKDDSPSTEKVSEIAGNWTATSTSFNGVNVIDEGGGVTMAIQTNGRFTFTIVRPDRTDMVFTGKLGFDEQWLAVEYDTNPGEYEYYDIDYDAHNMHIGANSAFDFDGDGADELVIFFLDMVR